MKKTKIIFLLIAAAIFGSCQKEESVVAVSSIESVRDLQVSANFDWKTTQDLNVSVILPDNGDIQPLTITNAAGTKTYFSGYPDDGSRTVNTKITIPSYLSELRLIYNGIPQPNKVSVSSGTLSYDLNRSNKTGKAAVAQINLGSIANFTLFTTVGAVSSVGASNITGNIGTNVGAVTGFTTPSVLNGDIEIGNSVTTQAGVDLASAVSELSNLTTTNSSHAPAFVTETLTPGVYSIGGASSITTLATLTLDGQGDPNALFVFKVAGAFTTGAGATVVLINGADPDNVFWLATGAISMAASTTISGNLIANPGAVDMGLGGILYGRMLSNGGGGAISLLSCLSSTPAQNAFHSGTLAFEDLWPAQGDYDFNDLVVGYEFDIVKDNQEIVQSITASFTIKAYGAYFNNGFGFSLPTVSSGDVVSVSGYDVQNTTVFSIGPKGLESGQSNATIIVFDDVRRVMPQVTGGVGVNTQLAFASTAPVTVVVEIIFSGNLTYSQLDIGSFNPFLIVGTSLNQAPGTGSRGKEVHLPNYPPSDLFDTNLFGSDSDDSSPNAGRYFVTANNLPSAINIAEGFDWAIESQDITGAYNLFETWAQSSGAVDADWYRDIAGNINSGLTYPNPSN